ncbi:monooxygenase flavin-binding family protein [Actinoplanes sp. NBRC 14428]|uniref:Cation diffusion facilitator CzcD-associated flavoprotein CzcO n=1 Tax=Pseudosporangium ferrugineum TaxID=439699 RepID=A0A2T0SIC7_9ACTN|nr:NAD(P)/FAD-dependent oxidoreductase [Pseudosporangium ferrugineum]PRY33175.1 cation diffusion facilitator CzcD-associated flavoprotein CzcO [Pseudosporangium ferrugineum]BCJ48837.1 monooxygenase flavin-binding family protein [Actinoplanes sp. NBRC 14428]
MPEHFDVLIVGAGLSGIGAAWRLRQRRPGTTYAILEARAAMGGTWDLFRYPGVRSDSDMFTLGYPFRPWRGDRSMAAGDAILRYIRDTADEGGITPHIRFGTRVTAASWADSRWTVTTGNGTFTCDFLYACAGYYDYAHGYQPDFPGLDDFRGTLVHPQFWPAGLDYAGKRVVVIGSGATAVTLVPAMAPEAAHVTMLQRSPTHVLVRPGRDVVATALRRLPPRVASKLVRAKNILVAQGFYRLSRRRPATAAAVVRRLALTRLNDPAYLDEHFTPTYGVWDQRLCAVPDGDLFTAIRDGSASVVTARIDRFVPEGIRLTGGRVLPADVVVSATGLSLLPIGGIELTVDGEKVDPATRVAYRGVMLSGVPNLAYCIGYTNASWTLRADLSHRYVCRLLSHMDRHGYATATPQERPGPRRPLLDLTSGYVQRALDLFPQQGDRDPWTVKQSYLRDVLLTPRADVRRDMAFGPKPAPVREETRR